MADAPVQQLLKQAIEHHSTGRLAQAEQIYRQILATNPQHADALHLLGVAAHQRGDHSAARNLILKAISLRPDNADYHNNYGEVCRAAGLLAEAEQAYRRAIAIDSTQGSYYSNLCLALRESGKLAQAIEAGRKAIQLSPDNVVAHLNLANALSDSNRFDQALACYQRALSIDPQQPQVLTAMGTTYAEMGLFDQATQCFDRAIAINDHPDAHWNRSLMRLLHGDYTQGWQEYEWRWRCPEFFSQKINAPQPQWDGSDISGRTILLYCEQGLGDTIQFVRYAPLVARLGATVILQCQRELQRLLASVTGIHQVVARGQELPPFELHLPLLSLPRLFKTTVRTIPASVPYISADPQLIEIWRQRLGPLLPGHRRVGLAWAGRPTHKNDRNRSMQLSQLAALASVPNVQWISLQKGPAAQQAANPPGGMRLLDLTDQIHDFTDTAALIANLDLIVCVDTAVAHLAGAMGRAVWIFLPFAPEWRWLLGCDDSPWYPSARLFRQKNPGQWDQPVNQAAAELARL